MTYQSEDARTRTIDMPSTKPWPRTQATEQQHSPYCENKPEPQLHHFALLSCPASRTVGVRKVVVTDVFAQKLTKWFPPILNTPLHSNSLSFGTNVLIMSQCPRYAHFPFFLIAVLRLPSGALNINRYKKRSYTCYAQNVSLFQKDIDQNSQCSFMSTKVAFAPHATCPDRALCSIQPTSSISTFTGSLY